MHIIVCITSVKQTRGCDAVLCEWYSLADAQDKISFNTAHQIMHVCWSPEIRLKKKKKREKKTPKE